MIRTYFIYDSIGQVGSQIAGDKTRAVYLWKKKFPNAAVDVVGKLKAFDAVNDKLPDGFIALREKNPKVKKRKPVKKRVRKNPVSTYIKVFRHGQGDKKFSQKGYFTGTGWNTEMSKAKKYSAGEAKKLAMQLKIPEGWGVAIVSG